MPRSTRLTLALAVATLTALARPRVARAQPVVIPASARAGDVPPTPGIGAQAYVAHSFFQGFPSDLRDARDLLEGRSIAPVFDRWCGLLPYVDLTNATVRDSLGREAPTVLCLPFLAPDRMMPAATCRALPGVPEGRYYQGGGMVLRVRAWIAIRRPGTYTFAWGHDDGVGMYMADTTVYEYRDPTGSRVDRRAVSFAAPGLYPFTLEWYDTVGGALIDWYVADGDQTEGMFSGERFRLVPTEDLYPSDEIPCTARCERCPLDAPLCDHARGRCVRCRRDTDCAPCHTCSDGVCRALADLPNADGGPACAPPPVPPADAGSSLDVAVSDVTGEPPVPRGDGCSCGVPRGATHSRVRSAFLVLLSAAASWLHRRRRRS